MGAVVGAALAAGVSVEQLAAGMRGFTRKDVAPLDPLALLKGVFARAILKPDGLKRAIARLVPVNRFEDLHVPLTVTATDLDSGELVLFGGAGSQVPGVSLHDALYASCALPLYYPPAEIDGRRLVDGGLRAVLPLEPAAKIPADLVVAVSVGPGFDEVPPPDGRRTPVPALVRTHGEAERVMMADQTARQIADWPRTAARLVVVRAVAEREATFALDQIPRYIEQGYKATQAALGNAKTRRVDA
jgi:NTE family protein